MVECPHSLYFFRSDVENFEFVDEFKGNKTAEELTEHPNPLLVSTNVGDYYRAIQGFDTTEDYVEGPGVHVNSNSYIRVVNVPIYNEVIPAGSENPAEEGWYEKDGDLYVVTEDTTVDVAKTYYEKDNEIKFDDLEDSVTNTLMDWHIVPLSRPVIAPPSQKLQTINIPGANGILDVSNSLTKYPVFENRTGTMKFAVLNGYDWVTTYTKIMRFLQGNNVKMIMEDDPKYYYEGRVYVDEWDSKSDGTWSEITLGYDLQPYRRSIYSSIDDWLWDPFNFETDVITDTVFKAIRVDSENWEEHDFTGLIDMMPVMPEFTVDTDDNQPLKAELLNTDLNGNNWKAVPNETGMPEGSNVFYNCILCENLPDSVVKMRFKGHGTVTIKFRSGRL